MQRYNIKPFRGLKSVLMGRVYPIGNTGNVYFHQFVGDNGKLYQYLIKGYKVTCIADGDSWVTWKEYRIN